MDIINKITDKHFFIESDICLPYGPKGKALELREAIKKELKQTSGYGDTHLKARLITSETDFFDVENILSYNIGSGSFS